MYGARHAQILHLLADDFSDWLEPVASTTGMHLSCMLRSLPTAVELDVTHRARQAGVRVGRLSS